MTRFSDRRELLRRVQDVDLGRVAARHDRRAAAAIVLLLAADELHAVDEEPELWRPDDHRISARLRDADRRRIEGVRIGADVAPGSCRCRGRQPCRRRAARLGDDVESVEPAGSEHVAVLVARREGHPDAVAAVRSVAAAASWSRSSCPDRCRRRRGSTRGSRACRCSPRVYSALAWNV